MDIKNWSVSQKNCRIQSLNLDKSQFYFLKVVNSTANSTLLQLNVQKTKVNLFLL